MRLQSATWLILSGAMAVAAFAVGRAPVSARVAPAPARAADDAPAPREALVPPHESRRWPALPMIACPTNSRPEDDAAALSEARRNRATFLLDGVFRQLAMQSRRGLDSAEARSDTVLPYLSGMLNGALQADPGMREAFSAQFTASLCDRTLAEDQAISVAHMALARPDVATEQGFECFFSKATESVPSWFMLDAWRRSGLAKTPAIARLQASATDPRTTRRFLSDEEALAERTTPPVSSP